MRRKRLLIAVSSALLGLLAGGIGIASTSSSDPPSVGVWGRPLGWRLSARPASLESHVDGQTIRLVGRFTNLKAVNVDGRRFGPGDYVLFREVLSTRSGRRVGHTNVRCMRHFPFTTRRVTSICDGTFTLSARRFHGRGEIAIQGSVTFTPSASVLTVAVTGGTGHYQNVRGELHIRDAPSGANLYTLHLIP